jgi:hypothetical protein
MSLRKVTPVKPAKNCKKSSAAPAKKRAAKRPQRQNRRPIGG